jgi:hypothetical protein
MVCYHEQRRVETFSANQGCAISARGIAGRHRKRGKTLHVIAGLVPAISIRMAKRATIGVAGTSPATTLEKRLT